MRQTTPNMTEWLQNRHFSPEYNEEELNPFATGVIARVHRFQQTHPLYTGTPLHRLKYLANHFKLGEIFVKDESHRFGLNAFKVLGGVYAVAKYTAGLLQRDIHTLSFNELKSPDVKEKIGQLTFISATDGNHGRGVAWAAKELGHKSVIYMPKGSSLHRLQVIRMEGAEADITDMNYDDSVRMCAQLAQKNGWVMVQDTAWEGYEEIPLWIMQGYSTMAKEIVEQLEEAGASPPTHLFLQAGVGSFAGAVAAYFIQYYRQNPPKIIIVEPHKANCYYRSFASGTGEAKVVAGDMDTIMAGLACGEPNVRAWRILRQYATAAFSCNDAIAALGMRILGNPLSGDAKIISGESGAVTAGLLYCLGEDADFAEGKKAIELDENSRVMLINTEGDTDPEHYLTVVWRGKYPY
jgi:diaminopropionate ammonia-lyase